MKRMQRIRGINAKGTGQGTLRIRRNIFDSIKAARERERVVGIFSSTRAGKTESAVAILREENSRPFNVAGYDLANRPMVMEDGNTARWKEVQERLATAAPEERPRLIALDEVSGLCEPGRRDTLLPALAGLIETITDVGVGVIVIYHKRLDAPQLIQQALNLKTSIVIPMNFTEQEIRDFFAGNFFSEIDVYFTAGAIRAMVDNRFVIMLPEVLNEVFQRDGIRQRTWVDEGRIDIQEQMIREAVETRLDQWRRYDDNLYQIDRALNDQERQALKYLATHQQSGPYTTEIADLVEMGVVEADGTLLYAMQRFVRDRQHRWKIDDL